MFLEVLSTACPGLSPSAGFPESPQLCRLPLKAHLFPQLGTDVWNISENLLCPLPYPSRSYPGIGVPLLPPSPRNSAEVGGQLSSIFLSVARFWGLEMRWMVAHSLSSRLWLFEEIRVWMSFLS